MNTEKIKIISEPSSDKPFIVIYKASGIPSAPLKADDEDNAFSYAAKLYPKILEVSSSPDRKPIEHGLIHRIDNVTSGLLLIAASQDFYNFLIEEQKAGHFYKTYSAKCEDFIQNPEELEGFPPLTKNLQALHTSIINGKTISISSFFRNYGKGGSQVRPVTKDSNAAALKKIGKLIEYTTEIKKIQNNKSSITLECKINSGYRHQVRCHLAWLGFPIIGDNLYNAHYKTSVETTDNTQIKDSIKFSATKLEFTYKGKAFDFSLQI